VVDRRIAIAISVLAVLVVVLAALTVWALTTSLGNQSETSALARRAYAEAHRTPAQVRRDVDRSIRDLAPADLALVIRRLGHRNKVHLLCSLRYATVPKHRSLRACRRLPHPHGQRPKH
jgi:hypothetical protein